MNEQTMSLISTWEMSKQLTKACNYASESANKWASNSWCKQESNSPSSTILIVIDMCSHAHKTAVHKVGEYFDMSTVTWQSNECGSFMNRVWWVGQNPPLYQLLWESLPSSPGFCSGNSIYGISMNTSLHCKLSKVVTCETCQQSNSISRSSGCN